MEAHIYQAQKLKDRKRRKTALWATFAPATLLPRNPELHLML
jgi:hypothetical protein